MFAWLVILGFGSLGMLTGDMHCEVFFFFFFFFFI